MPDHGQAADMTLPPWPAQLPAHGSVVLREVGSSDIGMARELSTDPYVPQTGSLPFTASNEEAVAWIERQRGRHSEGTGFSFTIATAVDGQAVGHCGLWLRELGNGTATAGYAIVPSQRRRGYAVDALTALTGFGWTMPELTRIFLHIESWNIASQRTAEKVGYTRQGPTVDRRTFNGETREMRVFEAVRAGS